MQKSGTLADEPHNPGMALWSSHRVRGAPALSLMLAYCTDEVYLLDLGGIVCVCAGPKFQDPKATLARRISVEMDGKPCMSTNTHVSRTGPEVSGRVEGFAWRD